MGIKTVVWTYQSGLIYNNCMTISQILCHLITHGCWVESNRSVISCVCYWQWYTGRDTSNLSRRVLPDSSFVFGPDVSILCLGLMSPFCVWDWCHHFVFGTDVTILCLGLMSPFCVWDWCHHFVFGTDVIILCKNITNNALVTRNFLVWTKNFILKQCSKWNFEFTGRIQILEFIFIYKNWQIYWSEQSFTGFGPEDRCSSWGLLE